MLNSGYFILLLVAFPLVKGQGMLPTKDSGNDCADICPTFVDSWCCKGVDYLNYCVAQCSNGGTLDGCWSSECNFVPQCPVIYDPVCCFITEQFGNSCEASRKYGGLPKFSELCVPGECS